ncbi:protein ZAR1-like [Chanos chanos]|uniref:Protein ZAR1-like n=1 Tax=Chanos chanos TaxID=29144 RepID=A0A6J2WXC2_CHACN|nr:ZAR1-like protein [Chanos chanos]
MEDFVISPYNLGRYPSYVPFYHGNPKIKYPFWNKRGHIQVAPEPKDYFDIYKRAQLKAILSQVNPNLTPRLRKPNTREFGVQVNPKVDAVVQCSLGPKTLFYREEQWESPKASGSRSALKDKLPSTPVNNVRFIRPVAIYSPVFDRRFFSLPADERESGGDDGKENEDFETSGEEKAESKEQHDPESEDGAARARNDSFNGMSKKFGFQFLEQKYGFFHCSKCSIRWESAYVWCVSGSCKVYFKQHCRKCQVGLNPYKVESIQCPVCSQTRCSCERKKRHVDMRRPHRQDLCGRCKGKRLSCDTTYSFKYIV